MKMEPNCFVEVATKNEMYTLFDEAAHVINNHSKAIRILAVGFMIHGAVQWWIDRETNREIVELKKEVRRLKEEREEE